MSDGHYKIQTTADEEQWRWRDTWQPLAPELCSPGLRIWTIKMSLEYRKDLGWSISHADPEAKITVIWTSGQEPNLFSCITGMNIYALASNSFVMGIMWSDVKGPYQHEWSVWSTRHSSTPRLSPELCLPWVTSLGFIILFWRKDDLNEVTVNSHTPFVVRVLHWVR